MKSSPILDLSFSALSAAAIAILLNKKPDHFEVIIIAVPVLLSIFFIILRYLAAWLQITSYETFAAAKKLQARKNNLHSYLNDKHLSEDARKEYQKKYEDVTRAIDKCLSD